MDDNFPHVYLTSRLNTNLNEHCIFFTTCYNANGKTHIDAAFDKSWAKTQEYFTSNKIIYLAALEDYKQTPSRCADFQHCCRPSYQHLPNTKVFAGVVYMNLTFTGRSSVTFPPTTTDIELLAVLPTWQGSVSSPLSSALQLSPTGWESGRVDGSVAWLLAVFLPSWPGERARMGSPVSECIDRGPALHYPPSELKVS